MIASKFIAAQLSNPNALFGKPMALVWNRRNIALNDTALAKLTLLSTDQALEVGFGAAIY